MQTYRVKITGTQPLLMHADDIEWADQMERWKLDKDNKKNSKAGDDRTPAHRWIGSLYRNEAGEVVLPNENSDPQNCRRFLLFASTSTIRERHRGKLTPSFAG